MYRADSGDLYVNKYLYFGIISLPEKNVFHLLLFSILKSRFIMCVGLYIMLLKSDGFV